FMLVAPWSVRCSVCSSVNLSAYRRSAVRVSGRDHGESLPPSDGGGPGLHRVVPVDLPRGEAVEDLVEGDPSLEPGQCGAEAEVQAVAEGEVVVDPAADVEAVAVGELAVVTVA